MHVKSCLHLLMWTGWWLCPDLISPSQNQGPKIALLLQHHRRPDPRGNFAEQGKSLDQMQQRQPCRRDFRDPVPCRVSIRLSTRLASRQRLSERLSVEIIELNPSCERMLEAICMKHQSLCLSLHRILLEGVNFEQFQDVRTATLYATLTRFGLFRRISAFRHSAELAEVSIKMQPDEAISGQSADSTGPTSEPRPATSDADDARNTPGRVKTRRLRQKTRLALADWANIPSYLKDNE